MSLRQQAAEILRRPIDKRELTQRELARRMGVSDVTVSQVLRGQQNLTLDRLERYALALGIDLSLAGDGAQRLTIGSITGEELYWSYVEQALHAGQMPRPAWDGLTQIERETWGRLAATVVPRSLVEAVTS